MALTAIFGSFAAAVLSFVLLAAQTIVRSGGLGLPRGPGLRKKAPPGGEDRRLSVVFSACHVEARGHEQEPGSLETRTGA